MQANENRGKSLSGLSKAVAVIAIAALGVGTGFLAGRMAQAGTSAPQPALYVSNVHVGFPEGRVAARQAREQWLGKNIVQVESTLGRPSQVYRLSDTGGEMLIYARPYHEHFVFEADPNWNPEPLPIR